MPTHFEEGRYRVRIVNQCFTESAQKKTLGFMLTFRVICNLEQPETPVKSYQRDMTWWITEKTANRVLNELRDLGYSGTTLSGVDPDTEGFHDFRNREIELTCRHEPNEKGDVFEQWSFESSKLNLQDKSQVHRFDRFLNPKRRPVNGGTENDEISDADVPY